MSGVCSVQPMRRAVANVIRRCFFIFLFFLMIFANISLFLNHSKSFCSFLCIMENLYRKGSVLRRSINLFTSAIISVVLPNNGAERKNNTVVSLFNTDE